MPSLTSLLDSVFRLSAHGTDVGTELRAGLTTFVSSSYLLLLIPHLFLQAHPASPLTTAPPPPLPLPHADDLRRGPHLRRGHPPLSRPHQLPARPHPRARPHRPLPRRPLLLPPLPSPPPPPSPPPSSSASSPPARRPRRPRPHRRLAEGGRNVGPRPPVALTGLTSAGVVRPLPHRPHPRPARPRAGAGRPRPPLHRPPPPPPRPRCHARRHRRRHCPVVRGSGVSAALAGAAVARAAVDVGGVGRPYPLRRIPPPRPVVLRRRAAGRHRHAALTRRTGGVGAGQGSGVCMWRRRWRRRWRRWLGRRR